MSKASHELDLLGQDIVDFEERLNVPRLKKERLQRLQAEMAKADLGGLLLFDPLNIRYATGRRSPGMLTMRGFFLYVLVPREGAPYIPEEHYDDAYFDGQEGPTAEGTRAARGSFWVAVRTCRGRPGSGASG